MSGDGGSEVPGIVDVSEEVYEFEVCVPRCRKWKTVSYQWVEECWVYKLTCWGEDNQVWARVGREERGEEVLADGFHLYVKSGHNDNFSAQVSSSSSNLRGFVREGRLSLKLLVSPEYRETNCYLSRELEVPPCTIKEDLSRILSSGRAGDVTVSFASGEPPIQYHTVIVGARSEEYKRERDWWPTGILTEQKTLSSSPDWDRKAWFAWLHYIYSGNLPETDLNTELLLLENSQVYRLNRLSAMVQLRLANKLFLDNILTIYSHASNYSSTCQPLLNVIQQKLALPTYRHLVSERLIRHPCLTCNSDHQFHQPVDKFVNFIARNSLKNHFSQALKKVLCEKVLTTGQIDEELTFIKTGNLLLKRLNEETESD